MELGVDILEAGFPDRLRRRFRSGGRGQPRVPLGAGGGAGARLHARRRARGRSRSKHAKRPRIHTFIATSDIHLKYKLKKTRQQVLDEAVAAVELARGYVDDVEFSAEDGARTDPDYLEQISQGRGRGRRAHGQHSRHRRLLRARRIRRADRPHRRRRWAIARSSACTATTIWAWRSRIRWRRCKAGARQIECTINGIGERAGNCSLEEIVMVIKTRPDRYPFETGIHTEHLYPASQLLTSHHHLRAAAEQGDRRRKRLRARGRHPSGRLPQGDRPPTKSSIRKSVGVPEGKLVLGKHSGRHALKKRCEELGFDLTREELDAVYHRFTALADTQEGPEERRDPASCSAM